MRIFTLLALVSLSAPLAHAEKEWTNLFDGKTLDGWVQRGGKAKYTVEEGVIVGSTVLKEQNSFLCTKKNYGNFVLELEFKVDPRLNSGVQFRSEVFPEVTQPKSPEGKPVTDAKGTPVTVPAHRVHGYQCEIDPDPVKNRWWTAGIYDEARRGWLFPGSAGGNAAEFTAQGNKTFKQNDWNIIRIEANGNHIRTWLNGTARADIQDNFTASGLIGLQVHSIGNAPALAGIKVHFRNIRIQDLGADSVPTAETNSAPNTLSDQEKQEGWKLLWDGKTNEGWRSAKSDEFPKKGWTIENGILTVLESGGKEANAGGDIITRQKFSSFELKVDFRITPGANSGIKYFVDPNLNKGAGSSIGLEFQILDDQRHPDAKLGRDGDRTVGSLYDLITANPNKKVNPPGEWNQALLIVRGKHVEHWLNGMKVVEYERGSNEFRELVKISKYAKWPNFGELPEGHILLQDHGNQVSFRNIKIRELPAQ